MFVDVVSLSSAFSVCLGTYSWSLGKGSIDENPRHRAFGFVRVQFAGAGWMYLPMRQWADATLCSSALDIAPPCMGICGPVAPSIAPINPPTIPPPGTTSCRQAQICD